jgi:DNA primase
MPRSLSKHVARFERGGGRKQRKSLAWLQHVDALDFLERLSISNISEASTEQIQFSCPFPDHTHGDETPSARMNNGTKDPILNTRWNCFGCKRSGNAIDFLSEYEGISRQDAVTKLKQFYAAGFVAPRFGSIAREFEARHRAAQERHVPRYVNVLDWSVAGRFEVDWRHYDESYRSEPDVAYMLDRGFTPADLEEWGIGYDYDSDRITIPVCDPHGNLVGFKGRAWKKNARPKYLVLGNKGRRQRYDFDTYDKSLVVFGIDKWGEVDSYVLVEGELDVMSLWVMDIPAICCGGSVMSSEQAKLIRQYCNEVVLFFDTDGAGDNGIYGYTRKDGEHRPGIIELLEPHLRVRVVGRHRYDANDYLQRGEQDRVHRLISSAKSSIVL